MLGPIRGPPLIKKAISSKSYGLKLKSKSRMEKTLQRYKKTLQKLLFLDTFWNRLNLLCAQNTQLIQDHLHQDQGCKRENIHKVYRGTNAQLTQSSKQVGCHRLFSGSLLLLLHCSQRLLRHLHKQLVHLNLHEFESHRRRQRRRTYSSPFVE